MKTQQRSKQPHTFTEGGHRNTKATCTNDYRVMLFGVLVNLTWPRENPLSRLVWCGRAKGSAGSQADTRSDVKTSALSQLVSPVLVAIERHCFDPSLVPVDVEKVTVVHIRVQSVCILLISARNKDNIKKTEARLPERIG